MENMKTLLNLIEHQRDNDIDIDYEIINKLWLIISNNCFENLLKYEYYDDDVNRSIKTTMKKGKKFKRLERIKKHK